LGNAQPAGGIPGAPHPVETADLPAADDEVNAAQPASDNEAFPGGEAAGGNLHEAGDPQLVALPGDWGYTFNVISNGRQVFIVTMARLVKGVASSKRSSQACRDTIREMMVECLRRRMAAPLSDDTFIVDRGILTPSRRLDPPSEQQLRLFQACFNSWYFILCHFGRAEFARNVVTHSGIDGGTRALLRTTMPILQQYGVLQQTADGQLQLAEAATTEVLAKSALSVPRFVWESCKRAFE
jgi:hypothetical protein